MNRVAAGQALLGKAAFGDWRKDKPGVRRLLTPHDLPAPFVTRSARNFPDIVPMPAFARPLVPEGFSVELMASGLAGPRVLRVAPNGDIFVADSRANAVRVFRVPRGT